MKQKQPILQGLIAFFSVAFLTTSNAEVLSPSPHFSPGFETTLTLRNFDWALAGTAYALALSPDGNFYLGGAFTSGGGSIRLNIARFNPDGTLDETFQPDTVNGPVHALQLQPDGRLVIGGDFTMVGAVERGGIARLNDDGSLDLSFDPGTGFDEIVRAVVLQPDGTLFIGGDFNAFDGNVRKRVAHLNANGSVNETFDPGNGPQGSVFSLAVQDDAKVVVGTVYNAYLGTTRDGIYRLNTNGTLDVTFDPPSFGFGSSSEVRNLVLQENGKIIAVGTFSGYGGEIRYGVARLNADASLDVTFNPATENLLYGAYAALLLPDGKILVAGHGNGNGQPGIVLLKATGALDSIFNPGSGFGGADISSFADGLGTDGGTVYDLAVQPDGRFLAAGDFGSYADTAAAGVVRLTSDGSLDFPFLEADLGTPGFVTSVAPMAGGRLLVGGLFQRVNGMSRTNIAVLNADATVDTNVVPELIAQEDVQVTAVAAQPDGKLVVGYQQAGRSSGNLARLDSSGAVDVNFYPGPGGSILYAHFASLVVQPDGKLLVNGALRYDTNAAIDPTYQATSSGGTLLPASAVILQPDGKVLVGGDFTFVNDVPRNRVARLNTNGTLDATFDPGSGFNAEVKAFALQDDGKIIVGGNFASFNGAGRNRIARLNPDGTLDTSFSVGSGFNNTVESLYLQPDDKVLAAGPFTSFSGTSSRYFVRLNADGTLDQSFTVPGILLGAATPSADGPNLTFPELAKVSVPVLMVRGGGSLLAGGSWLLFDKQVGGGLVLFEPPPPVVIEPPVFVSSDMRLVFTGLAGTTQTIQRASLVTGPWTNVAQIVIAPDGTGEFQDSNPPAGSGFYRTVQE